MDTLATGEQITTNDYIYKRNKCTLFFTKFLAVDKNTSIFVWYPSSSLWYWQYFRELDFCLQRFESQQNIWFLDRKHNENLYYWNINGRPLIKLKKYSEELHIWLLNWETGSWVSETLQTITAMRKMGILIFIATYCKFIGEYTGPGNNS